MELFLVGGSAATKLALASGTRVHFEPIEVDEFDPGSRVGAERPVCSPA